MGIPNLEKKKFIQQALQLVERYIAAYELHVQTEAETYRRLADDKRPSNG